MNEVQQAVQVLLDAVLNIIQRDPHQWSNRPCASCQTITAILGKNFGCYKYQERTAKNV